MVCELQGLRAGDSMDDSGTAWRYGEHHGLQSETVFPLAKIRCKADLNGLVCQISLMLEQHSRSLLIDPLSIFFLLCSTFYLCYLIHMLDHLSLKAHPPLLLGLTWVCPCIDFQPCMHCRRGPLPRQERL